MNKDEIISLFKRLNDGSWKDKVIQFVSSEETMLLSEKPGFYSVSNLLVEIKIRMESAQRAKKNTIGIIELCSSLSKFNYDDVVKNYVLKGRGGTGIVYLDEAEKTIVGAILVKSDDESSGSL